MQLTHRLTPVLNRSRHSKTLPSPQMARTHRRRLPPMGPTLLPRLKPGRLRPPQSLMNLLCGPRRTQATTVHLVSGSRPQIIMKYLTSDPAPTMAAQPIDHKIVVGADGLFAYNPANISASIGDTVTFEFRPKNHTVTQSSFSNPCQPLADTSLAGVIGFKSGL